MIRPLYYSLVLALVLSGWPAHHPAHAQTDPATLCYGWSALGPYDAHAVEGTITDATPEQVWTLVGHNLKGVSITMEATSGDLAPLVSITDGTTGAEMFGFTSTERRNPNRMVLATGYLELGRTYSVTATRRGGADGTTSGTYRLSIEAVHFLNARLNADQHHNIYAGEQLASTMGEGGRVHQWYAEGQAGDTATITLISPIALDPAEVSLTVQQFDAEARQWVNPVAGELSDSGLIISVPRYALSMDGVVSITVQALNQPLVYTLALEGIGGERPDPPSCSSPWPADVVLVGEVESDLPVEGGLNTTDRLMGYRWVAPTAGVYTFAVERTAGDVEPSISLLDDHAAPLLTPAEPTPTLTLEAEAGVIVYVVVGNASAWETFAAGTFRLSVVAGE